MAYLILWCKGILMGAADIVPGVSGGTLALLLGIYERLINAIRSVDQQALMLLLRGRVVAAWQHIDGTFLLCLFSGILMSVFALANAVSWMLEQQPVLLWALFNGLILSALPHLCARVPWNLRRLLLAGIGIGLAIAISQIRPMTLEPALWMFFVAGAIAICAMILPGISGSFILLLLGMYAPVLLAVTDFQLVTLLVFMAGCIVGLLSFSRFLSWLLARCHDATLALLIGVVIGALLRIWPWQLDGRLLTPTAYQQLVGSADIGWALVCAFAGVLCMQLMLRLERFSPKGNEC
ncbi:MAG: DUF368 domain-containing protein [Alkalimonas sp.]|nr:DUF368 domain-containing protein [Alkalimonas sp.]